MNSEDIFLGDLIQEANVSLMQALGGAGEELRDERWILGRTAQRDPGGTG